MAFLRGAALAIIVSVLAVAMLPHVHGENLQLEKQEIEAGLLYNFLKYIDWPDGSPASTVTICTYGNDPFSGYLQPMDGRTVNQRKIKIQRIDSFRDAKICRLLFINADEREDWPEISESLEGTGTLTVSDFQGFAQNGGMIEFGLKDNHIMVMLNMDAVTSARFRIQDRLMKLVTVVHPSSSEREP